MNINVGVINRSDPEFNFVIYNFILSILSILFVGAWIIIMALKQVLNYLNVPQGSFLDAFLLPIAGLVLPISLYLFLKLYGRGSRGYAEKVTQQLKQSGRIDKDFPVLSSSKLLAEKSEMVTAQVNGVFIGVMLLVGWTTLILPIGLFYYLLDWLFDIGTFPLNIWQLVNLELASFILVGSLTGLFKRAKEIEYLTQILKQIDVSEDDSVDSEVKDDISE